MRINYYFRKQNPGNNSIEKLFKSIIQALPSEFQIKVITAKRNFDWLSILAIRKEKANIHHITGAVNYFALGLPGHKTVLTVHDIGFFENATHSKIKRWIYGIVWFSLPLTRVKLITVVSDFTKAKLIESFKVDEAKIRVVHNPVLPHFTPQKLRLPQNRMKILHVGSGDHKNFKGLLQAVKDLPVHIIKIGSTSLAENGLIERYGISIERHINLSDEDVNILYSEADVLFFASFYEGFGMPIIEAQTVGKPVITSDFGSMKEVAANSAVLVDPNRIDEIHQAVVSLMKDEELYSGLVQKGRINAARFSMETVVSQFIQIYNELGE